MGKVQLYQRQSLDSSLVGTPGVSTAGNDLMQISDDVAQLTQQNIKVENAKIAIADNIEAERHRIDFENQFYKKMEEAKQANINDPYSVSDTAYDSGLSYASEMAQGITNPRVREKFMGKAQHSVETVQTQAREWASKTTADNAFINMSGAMDSLEAQAGSVRSVKDLDGLLNSAEQLAINSATVVGVEKAHRVYEATKKSIYENFAYSNIDRDPHAVKALVDSGMFDGVLDEKEQLSLKSSANSLVRKREVEAQRQNKSAHINTISALYDKEANGKLTLSEVNNAIVTFQKSGAGVGELKSLLSIKKSLLNDDGHSDGGGGKPGKVTYQTQAETLEHITDSYLNIFTKEGAEGKIKSRDTSLSDLQNLQNSIVKSAESKKLNKQTANSMLKNIVRAKHTLMDTKTEVTTDPGGVFGMGKKTKEIPLGVYNDGMRSATNWANSHIKDPKLRAQFKHDVITEYVNSYDKVKGQKGFSVGKYTNQIIGHYAPKYGKSVQVKKVK